MLLLQAKYFYVYCVKHLPSLLLVVLCVVARAGILSERASVTGRRQHARAAHSVILSERGSAVHVILSEVNVRPAHSRSRRIYPQQRPAYRSNLQVFRRCTQILRLALARSLRMTKTCNAALARVDVNRAGALAQDDEDLQRCARSAQDDGSFATLFFNLLKACLGVWL